MRRKQRLRKRDILVIAVIAIAVLAGVFLGAQWLEQRNAKPEPRGDYQQRYEDEKIEINGKKYRQKRNLTTILLMGIDHPTGEYVDNNRNGGSSDFMRLVVIDPSEKKVSQIAIDRDTMTPITILGMMGYRSGMRTMQIALAHGYGDGKEKSCELAVEAVSNMLFNVPIKYYVAMNLDGVPVLNDSVGGITVTLEDDFSHIDPSMTKGSTLTLMGKQAEIFVRSRMSMAVGTNEARMKRQEQYLSSLMNALIEKVNDSSRFTSKLYDDLTPYLCTNMNKSRVINETWNAREYQRDEIVKLPGRSSVSEAGFMEFHLDEDALQQLVLDLFYQETK